MKMNFQIMNCLHPNSVTNTCVFTAYEANDSVSNLHIALDRYKAQIDDLQKFVWRYVLAAQNQILTANTYQQKFSR